MDEGFGEPHHRRKRSIMGSSKENMLLLFKVGTESDSWKAAPF